MKAVMSNYAAKTFERLTVDVPCRMAILGPSPPYEYPVDDQVERVEKVVANMVKNMTKSGNI